MKGGDSTTARRSPLTTGLTLTGDFTNPQRAT
jgi:hypothetical protein